MSTPMQTSTRFRSPAAPKGSTLNTRRCTSCRARVRPRTMPTASSRTRGRAWVTSHLGSYATEKLGGEGGEGARCVRWWWGCGVCGGER